MEQLFSMLYNGLVWASKDLMNNESFGLQAIKEKNCCWCCLSQSKNTHTASKIELLGIAIEDDAHEKELKIEMLGIVKRS